MIQGFVAIQEESDRITLLVEMMLSVNRNLPCFIKGTSIIQDMRERIFPPINGKRQGAKLNRIECARHIDL